MKDEEKIFEDWRDSLGYDDQVLYEYLNTIEAYIDFAKHYQALTIPDVVGRSEQLVCDRCKKLEFMIDNGLGWKDMENDNNPAN